MSVINHLFYNKSNERMRQLIEAIRTRDFSLQYSLEHLKGEERSLAQQMNEVVNEFRKTTLEQETKYQYFGTMLDTINAFLIVADEAGKVHWMNRAAVDELCGFSIQHLTDLAVIDEKLPEQMKKLRPGHQQLVQLTTKATNQASQNEGKTEFVLSVVNFFHKGFAYRLYTLQNVQPIIQKKETDVQQQLVRVLTHEIMNSLTPIISLSDTLCEGLQQNTIEPEDALMALQAIRRRSNGLLQFVENYRKLQHVSQPHLEEVEIGQLVIDLQRLFPAPIFQYDLENPKLRIRIDRAQMEQVLINLLKNAQEAVEGENKKQENAENKMPSVLFASHLSKNKREIIMEVTDKGCGILPEVQERIFVPFFTTKTNGSGIGLSICKQIVTLHGGTITVASQMGQGTTFRIALPLY